MVLTATGLTGIKPFIAKRTDMGGGAVAFLLKTSLTRGFLAEGPSVCGCFAVREAIETDVSGRLIDSPSLTLCVILSNSSSPSKVEVADLVVGAVGVLDALNSDW